MDALQMLREDHRKVKELFRRFEEAEGKAAKQAIAETVLVELDVHSVVEEEVFYPAVRRQGNGAGELVERAEQEHHLVDSLMSELMEMEPGNMEFDAKFHTLIENVKSHIDEEEAEMLPVAAEVGLSRLERLGDRMERRRVELLSEGQNGRRRRRARTPAAPRATGGTTSTKSARPASSTRSRSASRTRSNKTSASRSGSASTKRSRSTTSRATVGGTTARRSVVSRTTSSNGGSPSARPRTVAQAGSRKRTTQTRSKMSGRRSGSQSGR